MNLRFKALLIAIMAGLAVQAMAQRPPTEEQRERYRIQLGITRDQNDRIAAIYGEDRRLEMDNRRRMGELYRGLQALYDGYNFDRHQAALLRKQICALYRQRLELHAQTQEKLRKVLTADQYAKLVQLARERFEQWRRDHPRPPGFGGGGAPMHGGQ